MTPRLVVVTNKFVHVQTTLFVQQSVRTDALRIELHSVATGILPVQC
jgi:hypothetical protein